MPGVVRRLPYGGRFCLVFLKKLLKNVLVQSYGRFSCVTVLLRLYCSGVQLPKTNVTLTIARLVRIFQHRPIRVAPVRRAPRKGHPPGA